MTSSPGSSPTSWVLGGQAGLKPRLRWLAPATLVIWVGVYLALPSAQAVVQKFTDEEIRQADQTEYLHKAARQGDHMAAVLPQTRGSDRGQGQAAGRTPLRLAAKTNTWR